MEEKKPTHDYPPPAYSGPQYYPPECGIPAYQFPPGPPPPYQPPPSAAPSYQSYPPAESAPRGAFHSGLFGPGTQPRVIFQARDAPGTGQTHFVVLSQPVPSTAVVYEQRPRDLTIPAILACLFCCCIPGIYAIVYACQGKKAADRGDYMTAEKLNKSARVAIVVSVVMGIIWSAFVIIMRIFVMSPYHYHYY